MSGLILPAHLRGAGALQRVEADPAPVILANGCEVRQRHVDMNRKGWRHEVTATWTERQAGEATRTMDTLWLLTAEDADRVARAAADELRAGQLRAGLSGIARRLRIELPRA